MKEVQGGKFDWTKASSYKKKTHLYERKLAHFTWRLTLGITLPNKGQSTTVSKSRLAAHLKNSASSWRVERGLAGSFCKEGDFSSAKAQFHPSTWSGGRSGISCNEATLCSKGGFVTYRIRGFSSGN